MHGFRRGRVSDRDTIQNMHSSQAGLEFSTETASPHNATLDSPSEAACRGNSDRKLRDRLTGQSELPRYYHQSGFGMLAAPPETFEADEFPNEEKASSAAP
jgi:hypothetical protein